MTAAREPLVAASVLGRWVHRGSVLVGIVSVVLAVVVLGHELKQMPPGQLAEGMQQIPGSAVLMAAVFTALNYLMLTGYDQLAFVYIRRRMSRWQVLMASFVGYAIANNVGFALLSGTSARYRFYSRWGLSGPEISRVVLFYSGTYWLGLIVLGGLALVGGSVAGLEEFLPGWALRFGGWALLALALAYPAFATLRRDRPMSIAGVAIPLPSPPLVGAQFLLSVLDWTLAAAVLYVLVPAPRPDFPYFLGAFLAAQLVALASHVPGGLGVFESLMILMLQMPAGTVLPALALFRVVYYLGPLAVALGVLVIDEVYHRRHAVVQWGNAFGTLTAAVAPKLIAVFTMLAGAVLLVSGATPARPLRLALLDTFLPLAVIEAAHFAGSLIGFGLLVVAWGLGRRLESAYELAAAGLVGGMAASILKGADVEVALVLGALLLALMLSRDEFDRRTPWSQVPPSFSWAAGAALILVVTTGLGLFAFRHSDYTTSLWWQFEVTWDFPRFLRATAGVLTAAAFVCAWLLLRRPPPWGERPTAEDLRDAASVIGSQTRTFPNLVFLRDKALLWEDSRRAFLMYAVQGRTWVAMGDPVGPEPEARTLVRRFLEKADDHQGVPVVYEASQEWLQVYAEYGLTFARLGEEARVFLPHFTIDGSGHWRLRTTLNRLSREGVEIGILEPGAHSVLPQLAEVSNAWLADHGSPEKGFATGFFEPTYVERFPVAVLASGDRVEAFAVLWPGAQKEEIAVDMMRARPSAPRGALDGLLASLLTWARQEGYRWFNLGLTPLAGGETAPAVPFLTRAGRFLYGRADPLYSMEGLRASRAKFDPVWEPRYVVYPGGIGLPRLAADLTALIEGGYRRMWG